jgi:hypothetical protein
VQLRVDNLETRAILGSSPRTMTHNTEYNNDEEHGPQGLSSIVLMLFVLALQWMAAIYIA